MMGKRWLFAVRLGMLGVLLAPFSSGFPVSAAAAGPVVWVEDGMTRVFRDDPAKANTTITLHSAKNEYEPFQIVVKAPAGNGLTGVNVTVSDLSGPNGASISAANVSLYREHYLFVTQGSKHQSGETNRPLGPGWYPDALIPFRDPVTGADLTGTMDAVPFDLAAGVNQPIWIDIYTPTDAPAGLYQGTATATSSQGAATIDLRLNVWDFELPKVGSLKGHVNTWNYSNRSTAVEILKHRMNPKHVPSVDEPFLMNNHGLDILDVFRASGATNSSCEAAAAPSVSEVQAEVAGHPSGLYLMDSYANEVWACASQAQLFLAWADNLRRGGIHPAIVTYPLDSFMGTDLDHTAADIWSILPKHYDQAKVNIGKLVNHATTQVWSYNPLVQDGYSPKFTIDFLPINARIMQGFINQSLGFTGTKFWRIDNWTADAWNNAEASRVDAPGEGMMAYPGREVGLPEQIVPSVRMKWFREGAEDYEYIEILKNLGEAQFALDVARGVGRDFHAWTQDKELLLSARKTLGDRIEQLTSPGGQTFADVPPTHPYFAEIEAVYHAGFAAGCATDPLRYCPEQIMNRAESAVFVERGIHSASYDPPAPATQIFADLGLDSWAAKWVHGLWEDQYTTGCGTNPLVYCPWQGHTRAEGCVFYLRMMRGATYDPPPTTEQTFSDVPLDSWYAKWVQAAYDSALLTPCQTSPGLRFCPNDPLTRSLAAYMMVQAKGLLTP